jgi:hypothetical protein
VTAVCSLDAERTVEAVFISVFKIAYTASLFPENL